jgi:DNA-binding TFAR19-related protein (PDSD5 family)
MITIQVATPESANAVEQAILALMADGNPEAWRISVELHTLN